MDTRNTFMIFRKIKHFERRIIDRASNKETYEEIILFDHLTYKIKA